MKLQLENVRALLAQAAERGATEIHFKVPNRPALRVHETLVPTGDWTLTPQLAHQLVVLLYRLSGAERIPADLVDDEFAFGIGRLGRFHAYVYRQRGSMAVVVRRVASAPPALSDLGLPVDTELLLRREGLLLVVGDGRADTVAALVSAFNARHRGHVVLLERPLTYLHRDAMASIAHREVGPDVPSFAAGVAHAVRIGADLLVLGEVPDADTASAVMRAVDHGVPTVAALTVPDAGHAVRWFARKFTGQQRQDITQRVQRALSGVIVATSRGEAHLVRDQPPRLASAS